MARHSVDRAKLSYETVEAKRKRFLAKILIVIGFVVLGALGATAFLENNFILGIVDHVTAGLMGVGFVYLSRGGNYATVTYALLVSLGALFLFLLLNGGVAWTAYMWIFIYPLATVYLLGSRHGALFSSALVVVFATVRVVAENTIAAGHPYHFDFMIRFVTAYGVVLLISLYFENSRSFAARRIRENNKTLQALSESDGLTGVRNRRFFDEELVKMWRHASRDASVISLLLIDLDNFKLYNDTYGHLAGDDVLRKSAEILTKHASRLTDTVARYGGEEFTVILPGTNLAGACQVAERIVDEFNALNIEHTAGVQNRVTVSIGVATLSPSSSAHYPTALIDSADRALYKAKALGKARFSIFQD